MENKSNQSLTTPLMSGLPSPYPAQLSSLIEEFIYTWADKAAEVGKGKRVEGAAIYIDISIIGQVAVGGCSSIAAQHCSAAVYAHVINHHKRSGLTKQPWIMKGRLLSALTITI